jgi:ribulose-phosphate 3-epimerase
MCLLDDPKRVIDKVRKTNMRVGIAVKPKTKIEEIEPFISLVDLVLVMTVEPGFGGQRFMEDCISKVAYVRSKYPQVDIQVDGGLDLQTIDVAAAGGANVIVAGTSIFKAQDPKLVIDQMREAVSSQSAAWKKMQTSS